MRRQTLTLVSAAVVLSLAASAPAGLVIDQDQPNYNTVMAYFAAGGLAQSFQQAHNNVAGAGIRLHTSSADPDMITIALWDKLPNQGGTLLKSQSALGTPGTWVDVSWSPEIVSPDTTLYLVLTSATNTLGISGDTSNPYGRGQVYAGAGFGSFPDYDYTFRTYYDPTVVPVPAGVLLGAVGLGTAGYLTRRRTA